MTRQQKRYLYTKRAFAEIQASGLPRKYRRALAREVGAMNYRAESLYTTESMLRVDAARAQMIQAIVS